jgi:iron complex outermembrane receptor protein
MKTSVVLLSLAGLVRAGQGTGEPLKQLSLEALGNTEVTSVSKEPVKVTRTPAAIYVITQDDIRRSGVTSIPDALRLAPGVEVVRVDSNKWSVGVRGFASRLSRSVLVLIDGRSVYTPLFAGVYWEVQDTLLADIDRIEVIRGPGGTIWGPNAVNGVINIITKSAKDTHGMLASTGGGNVDQGLAGFRYGGGNGRNLNYRVYGKGFTRGPEFHSDHREFDDWRLGQAGFRTDWDLNSRDTVTVQGDLYTGLAGESTGIATYSPPAMTTVMQNGELSGGNLLGRWRRVMGEGSDVQVEAYYDRTSRREPSFAEVRSTFDIDFVHHLTLPGRQDFGWGLGVNVSSGDASVVVPTILFTPNQRTNQLYSAFLQDDIPLVRNHLWLTVGSKFLHNDYTGFEIQPAARILWTPSARQTLWAAVTRAVRTPSRIEEEDLLTGLLTKNPPVFLRLIGDGKFISETLLGYEFGYRSLVRTNFYLDIAGFRNNYDHLLSIEPGAPFQETSPIPAHLVVPFLFRNGVLGYTSGFEIAPSWKATRRWRLAGSYSYLHMDLKTGPDSLDTSTAKSTAGQSPHHQAVIQSFLDLPGHFEFDQTYRYVSDLPAALVGSYGTADVRLAWRGAEHLEWSVAGQNLLQPHHAESSPLVGIKRGFYVALTWRN